MDSWRLLSELVGLLGLALVLALAARRLRQKAAIGYLLAGLLAGPKGLGLVCGIETVQFLAELGVALLLFGIGLEFSWQRIGALGRRSAAAGLVQFGLTWTCGAAAARGLGLPPAAQFVLGNVLALSSTAFVLRILQDRAEMDSGHGRIGVGILLLQDLLLIPLLVLQSVAAQGQVGWGGLVELALQLVKGGALLALLYLVVRVFVLRTFRGADTYAEREVPVILSVFVCLGCAWASHVAGLSPILGAFLAGVLLADQPIAGQVRANVAPLQAVFFTLFFASIGMLAGFPRGREIPLVLMLAAGIVAGKALLAGLAIRCTGSPGRVAVLGGLAVAQIGEFSFVLAEDALVRGLLPASWFDPLIAASVLTLLATPYLLPLGNRLVNLGSRRRVSEEPSGAPQPPEAGVLVVGYGPAGREVARALTEAGVPVTIVESNPNLARDWTGSGLVIGDATHVETLLQAGARRARLVVLTVPDPGVARTILRIVQDIGAGPPVLVRARYHRYAGPLRNLGAETVVDEEYVVGRELARLAERRLGLTPESS